MREQGSSSQVAMCASTCHENSIEPTKLPQRDFPNRLATFKPNRERVSLEVRHSNVASACGSDLSVATSPAALESVTFLRPNGLFHLVE